MLSIFHLLGQDVLTQSRKHFRMYLSYLTIIIQINLKELFYTSHNMIFFFIFVKLLKNDT